MTDLFFGFFSILIFLFFYKFSFKLGKSISLVDKNNQVPTVGGILLFIGLTINFLYAYYSYEENIFLDPISIIFVSVIFIFALIDDIFNISAILRLIICSVIITIFFTESEYLIKTLNFKYLGVYLFPENFFIIYFFSIFCMIVLLHAFNFIDGINTLASFVGLIWLLYLIFKIPILVNSTLIFIIFLVFFIFLNFKNISFLGDSGNYIISSMVGIIIIKENLNNPYTFYVEEILLLFLIPGIDLIRLFFFRIKSKKNPLIGDQNHLHHKLLERFSLKKTLIIYLSLIVIPIIFYIIEEDLLLFLIIATIIIYSFIIKKLSFVKK